VTATRLLVTSRYINQLMQFDAVGDELRIVHLSDYIKPRHAVESPTGTFIVSHKSTQLEDLCQVSEFNAEGQVLRQFSGSRRLPLGYAPHVAVDSQRNIIVADLDNRRILLLDAQLALRRVIVEGHQLNYNEPRRLCYVEQSGQLLVGLGGSSGVLVFHLLQGR